MPGEIAQSGVGIDRSTAPDYRDRITEIRQSLGGSRIEVLGRFLLPGMGVTLVTLLTQDIYLGMIYGFFLVTQAMLYGYLATRGAQCSRFEYGATLALAALTSGTFVAIGMYMWSTHVLVAQFAAYCLVQGFATYGLTRSRMVLELMIIDTVPILIGALYASSSLALMMADQVHPAVTLAIALMILAYYVASLYNVYDAKTKLRRAENQTIATERLQAVGRLTGGVAHDFNNILTAVLGHLDLYNHLTQPAEKDNCVAEAHHAASRAAKLTSQLLFFARKARLTPVATDLAVFLDSFASRIRPLLAENVKLNTVLPPQLPLALVDQASLDIVLMQLVLNARDSMGAVGTLVLTLDQDTVHTPRKLQGATTLAPGSYCVIRLADTGAGISPALLSLIFEPFFTTKAKGQSSGLGLPMAAGFAEMSGGAISMTSTAGAGSTVALYLPAIGGD
jgi:two-component system, cell cycle sensor histidine kinase and response regulator CckA